MDAPPHRSSDRRRVAGGLGLAQTLAWGSSYYLPAVLAPAIARDAGVSVPTVFALFSAALVVSAFAGPWSGRAIDRWGGRPVLAASSVLFALGLVGLAAAQGLVTLAIAWAVLGLAMGSGLYDAAFAALVRRYGADARPLITGVTLLGGLASTVGWPLSAWMEAQAGWRAACLGWAALHLLLALPLHLRLLAHRPLPPSREPGAGDAQARAASANTSAPPRAAVTPPRHAAAALAAVFAATWFISTAMAAHLPRLLQLAGIGLAAAVAIGALIGPAQVVGRLVEFRFLRRVNPLSTAMGAALLHPLGVGLLALGGAAMAAPFAVLHGLGNGILTIANGTLPLVLFGSAGYGARQGLMMVPARIAQALSPWLFGLALDRVGAASLLLSAALGLIAFAVLAGLARAMARGSRR